MTENTNEIIADLDHAARQLPRPTSPVPTLTFAEIDQRIEQAPEAIKRILRDFQLTEAHHDAETRLSESRTMAEHQARTRAAEAALATAEYDARERLRILYERTWEIVRHRNAARDADPTLSESDMRTANIYLSTIQEDAERLPLAALVRAVREDIAAVNGPKLWLWMRYARGRLARDETMPDAGDDQLRAELQGALLQARTILKPDTDDLTRRKALDTVDAIKRARQYVDRRRDAEPVLTWDGRRKVAWDDAQN